MALKALADKQNSFATTSALTAVRDNQNSFATTSALKAVADAVPELENANGAQQAYFWQMAAISSVVVVSLL